MQRTKEMQRLANLFAPPNDSFKPEDIVWDHCWPIARFDDYIFEKMTMVILIRRSLNLPTKLRLLFIVAKLI